MYSDDEEVGRGGRGSGGRSRSPSRKRSPPRSRGDDRRGASPRSRGDDRRGGGSRADGHDDQRSGGSRTDGHDDRAGRDEKKGGKDKGKGKSSRGPRTTGTQIPALHSIHKGTVARVQPFGAFVRLGDGNTYKDGLLHISCLSASSRVEQVEDVVAENDIVWVKVTQIKDEDGKYSVDMRFVGQKDGEDKDPHNTQADNGSKGKGKGKPDPIRIGAVQATTCTRCGAKGHMAKECFAGQGKQYGLLEEVASDNYQPPPERVARSGQEVGMDLPDSIMPGKDPKVVKAALKAFLKRKNPDASSSRSSSSSSSKKKKKKEKKKEKKALKKEKKKEKKAQKKQKKEAKIKPKE